MTKGPSSVFLSSVASITLAFLTSCGGGSAYGPPPPVRKTELLYVTAVSASGTAIRSQLASFQLDAATGILSSTSSATETTFITGLAVEPAAKFLYTSDLDLNLTPGSIEGFSITPKTGVPVSVGSLPLGTVCPFCPIPSSPGAQAFAPSGTVLYYASSTPVLGSGIAQGIGALKVATDGSLSAIPGSPFAADQIPLSLVVHPSGKFVYTANIGQIAGLNFSVQSISIYAVDPATGALSPAANSPLPVSTANSTTLQNLVIHPSGKYLYLTTGNSANGVLGWSIEPASGSLAPLAGSPFVPGSLPGGAVFDAAGRFLYTGAGGSISVFSADPSSGTLTATSSTTVVAGANFTSPVIDPAGNFLFVGDGPHKSVTGFRVDPQTGSLTVVGNPVPVNGVPGFLGIVVAP